MKENLIFSNRKRISARLIVSKVLHLINSVSEYSGKIVSFLVWAGALVLAYEVVARYLFNSPTVWVHGYSQRIFATYFILIGAFTLLKGGHVRVDILTLMFSSYRVRKAFDLINYAFLIFWGGFLVKEGWRLFLTSWKIKEIDEMVLGHPIYPFKFILVVGALLITLQAGAFFAISLTSFIKGQDYER